MSSEPLLALRDLRTWFHTPAGIARVVDGVSFELAAGETLGLVGESGCGKSLTALSILGLLPSPRARIEGGAILFRGVDLLTLPERALRALRGARIAMIFQEPMSALNPVLSIGRQIGESLELHHSLSRSAAHARAQDLLARVGIADPARSVNAYPHQLSGGMRQRAMIAMAIACDPELLIADEPTTALDVTIQAQILELLRDLRAERGMGLLLITHDLAVVAEEADQVAVMYAGKIVERAPVATLYARPRHPYTIGLLGCASDLSGPVRRPQPIPGQVPSPERLPSGCRFRTRCSLASERCATHEPELRAGDDDPAHAVACHHPLTEARP